MSDSKKKNLIEKFKDNVYPKKEEASVSDNTFLVDGIGITNQGFREKALSHVWKVYNMLPEAFTDSLAISYNIIENNIIPQKNYKSLFDYTHDKQSVYSSTISQKNLTVGGENGNSSKGFTNIPKEGEIAWHNTPYVGVNYYEYIKSKIDISTKGKFYTSTDNTENGNDNLINYKKELDEEKNNLRNELVEFKKEKGKPQKPKKSDFKENGDVNEEKYTAALNEYKKNKKDWKKNNTLKGRKEIKNKIKNIEDELNNFSEEPRNLIQATSKLFLEGINDTHEKPFNLDKSYEKAVFSDIDTSVVNGTRSRGRSLLKENDFARVWTFNNEYGSKRNTLIRTTGYTFNNDRYRSVTSGYSEYSVLKDGFVRITPEILNNGGGKEYNTKSCMFSIENLAWKDVDIDTELSPEQRGPNGGRIMWFPPYNLKFQENVSVNWNPTTFIGRGEKIYTYTDTDRMGTLSFTMLIDYPSIMDNYINDSKSSDEQEQEILRYFAGCDEPIIFNKSSENKTETNEKQSEEKESVSDEYAESLKFSVYFPYNYSGEDEDKYDDFVEKLLFGINNLNNFDELVAFQGYEMLSYKGITNTEKNSFECNGREYYYPIDKEACEYFLFAGKYRDDNSYQLNSKEYGGKNCSFGDIYYLFNHDNKKWEKDSRYLNHFIDCELLRLDGNKIISTNDEIKKIIEKGGIGKCKININSNGDTKENFGLHFSSSRATSVKNYLEESLKKSEKPEFEIHYNNDYASNDIHSKENKKKRRVDVEIKFNFPQNEGSEGGNVNESSSVVATTYVQTTNNSQLEYKQYNEADYFKQIREKDNFLYERIIDKVKFFEPAFHSMSPEGFNSRLNFLHQCTRQGHTIERKSGDSNDITSTAWNMAFGRPPVCVLRIGDFLNTKILIDTMSITYENGNGIQWDLNPEGVGVQPMFANVNLGIKLIGGQSLDAPISRLNNAVSFNYYANTKVYDTRADFAKYDNRSVNHEKFYIAEQYTSEGENATAKS